MSKKDTNENSQDKAQLFDVDELAAQKGIDSSTFAGIKMLKGWKQGKKVSVQEFEESINEFRKKGC